MKKATRSPKPASGTNLSLPSAIPAAPPRGEAGRVFRAAPEPDQSAPASPRPAVYLPGNWSNPPGGNWSDPPGGNWSNPPGLSVPPPGTDTSDPVGTFWANPFGYQRLVGMGYHPDLPDWRDHDGEHLDAFVEDAKKSKNRHLKAMVTEGKDKRVGRYHLGDDPRRPLPPIENQGQTNSCTAQAASALMEYLYRSATGEYTDFSRLFIYFNSRKMLGWTGDAGAYIRTTFKAMSIFGVPPEPEWPFNLSLMDAQPLPYHYAYAGNFKTLKYARLDGYQNPTQNLYEKVKETIRTGFPVEFGFPVYSCIQKLDQFVIPVPRKTDKLLGGHAVLAVGYDENVPYKIPDDGGPGNDAYGTGALIIRNSWGVEWGDQGYGFLPKWYIEKGYASDFWTAFDLSWIELNQFDGKRSRNE